MPRYTIKDDRGRSITVEGDSPPTEQEAEDLFGSVKQQSALAQPKKTFLQRFGEALTVPEGDRKALHKERQEGGIEPVTGLSWSDIKAVPSEIGKEFIGSAKRLGSDISSMFATDPASLVKNFIPGPMLVPQGQLETAGDLGSLIFSPATGAANALVGRPIEAATGVRREIPGAITSSLIPFGGEAKGVNTLRELSIEQKAILDSDKVLQARKAGYVLSPHMYDKPGAIDVALAGVGGRYKVQQKASGINQEITNRLAAQDVGVPPNTDLTPEVLKTARKAAAKPYKDIKALPTKVVADDDYLNDLSAIEGSNSAAAKVFPALHKNPHAQLIVDSLLDGLSSPRSTEEIVDEIGNLRESATKHFKGMPSQDNIALGFAKRDGAKALEDLLERNLAREGRSDMVQALKAARQQIAKLHDLETATDGVGNVNAQRLAALKNRGRPFTGNLKIIADTADAFPKAMQPPKKFGGEETFSAIDAFISGMGLIHGDIRPAAAIASRPLARAGVLSTARQNAMARNHGLNLLRDFGQSAPKTRNYLLGVAQRTSPFRRASAGMRLVEQMAQTSDDQ